MLVLLLMINYVVQDDEAVDKAIVQSGMIYIHTHSSGYKCFITIK